MTDEELLLVERRAAAYLYREAQCLDHYRYRDWLNLLSRDLEYRAPIRTSREAAHSPGFSANGFHFDETWGRLDQRVRRLETEYAWAEDPPSRVRRFVTNILVDPDSRPDEVRVSSYLLITRARLEDVQPHFLSAERQDVLRDEGDGYRLLNRLILLDHTIVPTPNLGIFLWFAMESIDGGIVIANEFAHVTVWKVRSAEGELIGISAPKRERSVQLDAAALWALAGEPPETFSALLSDAPTGIREAWGRERVPRRLDDHRRRVHGPRPPRVHEKRRASTHREGRRRRGSGSRRHRAREPDLRRAWFEPLPQRQELTMSTMQAQDSGARVPDLNAYLGEYEPFGLQPRALEWDASGVGWIVAVGNDLATSEAAVDVAWSLQNTIAGVGLHPRRFSANDAGSAGELEELSELAELASDPQVAVISDVGVDETVEAPLSLQMDVLKVLLDIAKANSRSVLLHWNAPVGDLLEFWDQYDRPPRTAILGFRGKAEQAQELIDRSFLLLHLPRSGWPQRPREDVRRCAGSAPRRASFRPLERTTKQRTAGGRSADRPWRPRPTRCKPARRQPRNLPRKSTTTSGSSWHGAPSKQPTRPTRRAARNDKRLGERLLRRCRLDGYRRVPESSVRRRSREVGQLRVRREGGDGGGDRRPIPGDRHHAARVRQRLRPRHRDDRRGQRPLHPQRSACRARVGYDGSPASRRFGRRSARVPGYRPGLWTVNATEARRTWIRARSPGALWCQPGERRRRD